MSEQPSIRRRIMDAATASFLELGFNRASTAEIARLARVSKRDIYANFPDKGAMLIACISERADAMRRPLNLPTPETPEALHETLLQYGATLLRELSRPEVLATYRLAAMDSAAAARVAQTLDQQGRAHNTAALVDLLRAVTERGLLRAAPPDEMAEVFLGILAHGGLLMRMVMRVRNSPDEAEVGRRATLATSCLECLYTV